LAVFEQLEVGLLQSVDRLAVVADDDIYRDEAGLGAQRGWARRRGGLLRGGLLRGQGQRRQEREQY
jgi:hypothetical protein